MAEFRKERAYSHKYKRRIGLLAIATACLTAGANASASQSVSLSWSASTNSSVTGYVLYRGISSGNYTTRIDVGTNTTVTLAGLQEGLTNYIAVAAYNAAGVEGAHSPEITFLVPGILVMLPNSATGNPMRLKFPVAVGHWYEIQASADLRIWATISQTSSSTSNAWVTFQDPQSGSFSKRFYRLLMH